MSNINKVTIIDDSRFFRWGWEMINGTWINTIRGYDALYMVKDKVVYIVEFKETIPLDKIDPKCIMKKFTLHNRVYECDKDVLEVIEKNAKAIKPVWQGSGIYDLL